MQDLRQKTEPISGRGWAVAVALLGFGLPLFANVQEIHPRPNREWNRGRNQGEMNIRLRVDQDVEVAIQGSRVRVRTLGGRWATDQGSDMSAPLPMRPVPVEMSRRDGRGRVWVIEQPSHRNGFRMVLRISDPQRGDDRYHVRLRYPTENWGWERSAAPSPRPAPRPALGPGPRPLPPPSHSWNNSGSWNDGRGRNDNRHRNDHGPDAWRQVSFGRPNSWNRLPGRPLDARWRERAPNAHGRNGGRFEFRGRIDDEVLFFIRGGQVTAQTQAGRGMQLERWSLDQPFPAGRPVRLQLSRRDGRGRVEVLESPHPSNNYTTVLRVYDPRGGSDRYHFRLDWRW